MQASKLHETLNTKPLLNTVKINQGTHGLWGIQTPSVW
ncbi:hypothetical protein MC7420_3058 [Coleofasciculus chthonoplastes PCC 7420]|uniref:Uncharacterized protein n=1 Tax=Coleofasciculus chthonoplastes PCC 7420 TaxID=118168 RepID=B4VJZ9_9CYAN|nr:hypothetical protein MC7420_3058 [Coleofasciculus chthonoplastes PCC 7420]